jgi:hypothetical protein
VIVTIDDQSRSRCLKTRNLGETMMSKFLRIFAVFALMGVLVGFFTPVAAAAPAAALPPYFSLSATITPSAIMVGQRVKFVVTINYTDSIPLNQVYNVNIVFANTPAGWLRAPMIDPATTLNPALFNTQTLTWTGALPARTGTETVAGVIAFTVQAGLPNSVGTQPTVINNIITLSDQAIPPVFSGATANGSYTVLPNYMTILPVISGNLQ